MAVNAPALKTGLMSQFASKGIIGEKATNLAEAISSSFVQHILSMGTISTVDAGVLGGGTGAGKVAPGTYPAVAIQSIMYTSMVPSGPWWAALCSAIAQAASDHVTGFLQCQTAVAGVSNGAAVLSLVGGVNSAAYTGQLFQACVSQGMTGELLLPMCSAIAAGLITPMYTMQFIVADVGAPVPPFNPSSGSGKGKIF